jgi:hypothetical protein
LAGVLTPNRLAGPGVVEGSIGLTVGVGAPTPRPVRSCRGEDPAVTVVMTVHGSEGTVLIDDQWEAVTDVELAAARRAGSPA